MVCLHSKFKLPEYQHGQAYLTSHRACYVDHADPRARSVAVHLKDVERADFYAGFLKSSAKITLYPKPIRQLSRTPPPAAQRASPTSSDGRASPVSVPPPTATWVCPICSFSNPLPSNFDPTTANARTPLPPCLACGIKPPLPLVAKAAIAALRNRPVPSPLPEQSNTNGGNDGNGQQAGGSSFACPRCTFHNHPSLLVCEMCGASLQSAGNKRLEAARAIVRPESPGPILSSSPLREDAVESIKFSFRGGGEKVFYERLKNALVQRKWLLQSAPPFPRSRPSSGAFGDSYSPIESSAPDSPSRPKVVGIAGLERRGLEQRRNNEVVIGNAFEDLEALMASAKDVIALAEQFATQANLGTNGSSEASALASQSASALSLITTKDMVGSGSESLYVTELSRNLAEWLTDDSRGVLRNEGGIVTLVDLWALFNRTRGGVELISPTDFERAARKWDELRLPVRLRQFKSGLLVVQGRDRTDEKTIASLLAWLRELHLEPPAAEVSWDWRTYGRGVTAQEAAERFKWSVGVATEELEMAEERGALCREQGLDGLKFWENYLSST